MRQIFLGPPLHWLILIALIAAGWISGKMRLHVSEFNPFLIASILITVTVILVVLKTSRPGDQVTRDPIVDGDQDAPAAGD